MNEFLKATYADSIDLEATSRNFETVYGYLREAIEEVAVAIGGDMLLEKVAPYLSDTSLLPLALEILNKHTPGAAKIAFDRLEAIHAEALEREDRRVHSLGSRSLRLLKSVNPFGAVNRFI